MNKATTRVNTSINITSRKSYLTQLGQPVKQKLITQSSDDSNSSIVRLGDYVRKRKWSKQKLIIGQVTSKQLFGQLSQLQKQLDFKKENINRFYNKIIEQIEKRRKDMIEMSQICLIKEQKFIQEVLKIIKDSKEINLEKINLYPQISNNFTSISSVLSKDKDTNGSFTDNLSFLKTYQQKINSRNSSCKKQLEDSIFKQFQDPQNAQTQQFLKQKHNSFDFPFLRRNTTKTKQPNQNLLLSSYQSKTPKASSSKKL